MCLLLAEVIAELRVLVARSIERKESAEKLARESSMSFVNRSQLALP